MIGHSCPTLEKMAYIPTMLNNRINWFLKSAVPAALALAIIAAWLLRTTSAQQQAPQTPAVPPGTAGGSAAQATAGLPAPAPQPEEPPTDAERTIDAAVKMIAKLQSVTAKLVQSVDMLSHKFTITGEYKRAPGARIRLLLTVAGLHDSDGTTLQVCDGETLWDYQQILDRQVYRKLTIKPVLERLNSPDLDPKIKTQAITQMGLSGPETLLVGLRKYVKFDQKEEVELQTAAGAKTGKRAWKLHGIWKNRQGLMGPDARPVSPLGILPPYIPMDVTLYLGKDDGWPYLLLLQGRPSTALLERPIGPDGRAVGAKSSMEKIPRTIITLEYSDVTLNRPIDVGEFAFQAPANATVDDSTEALIKGLDRELEREAQKKKSEAARKEGAVIDQSINLPAPPDAGANP
jgi:outer membrane lipoprotein-sorting protein